MYWLVLVWDHVRGIAKEGKVFGISPKDITFEESLRVVGVALEDWDPETETVMVKV